MLRFEPVAQDGLARSAQLKLAHGLVETPAFMPVGTLGSVKGLLPQQLREAGAQIVLMNAFHLAWRPGEAIVDTLGGLHRFTGWDGPILTDSGGYQIFSLPGLRKITEEGASFVSAIDGQTRNFTPESVVDLEVALGADMIMPLDECPPYPCSSQVLSDAVERSIRWAQRAYRHFRSLPESRLVDRGHVNLFGIVQGCCDESQRQRSIEATCAIPFAGFALGGFCVGEENEQTHAGIAFAAPRLPTDKPRYLMGMGTPLDILHAVAQGVDLFDCTLPSRNGRNGMAFTSRGPLRLKNARHARSEKPLDECCKCYVCKTFTRAFIRHLFLAREMNAAILVTLHNIAFYLETMREIREAIRAGRFHAFRQSFEERYAFTESN